MREANCSARATRSADWNWSEDMGLIDKLRGSVTGKAKEISEKVAESYREHIGEELGRKQEELRILEVQIKLREENIAEREAKLSKYYLIPRFYINIPIGLIALTAMYFGYKALTPGINTRPPQAGISPADATSNAPSTELMPSYSACVSKGVAYYQEIGSYPYLSTGEDARKKVEGNCNRSRMAFGR